MMYNFSYFMGVGILPTEVRDFVRIWKFKFEAVLMYNRKKHFHFVTKFIDFYFQRVTVKFRVKMLILRHIH